MGTIATSLPRPAPGLLRLLVPRTRGLAQLSRRIGELCRREALSEGQLTALLTPVAGVEVGRLRLALAKVLVGEVPGDRVALLALARQFEERFAHALHPERVTTPFARFADRSAQLVGALLATGCIYVVAGGLLAGESRALPSLPRLASLLAFLASLGLLGLFEAMHTAATQLHLADLSGLRESHPRAWALHSHIQSPAGINRFLAGRQIVVVVVVFCVAALTAFPDMRHLPFTEVPVPSQLAIPIDLGIPGALVVLWFAQLSPQFYATRHALDLMNTWPASAALRIAFALQSVGISRPVDGAACAHSTAERIPLSRPLRWLQDAEEVDGDGALSVVREPHCGPDHTDLRATSTTSIHRSGRPPLTESTLLLPTPPSRLVIDAELLGTEGPPRQLAPTDYEEVEVWAEGERRLIKVLKPAAGSFRAGEIVRAAIEAHYDGPLYRDSLLLERPVRFLGWTLSLSEEVLHFGPVRVSGYRFGPDGVDFGLAPQVHLLEPDHSEGAPPTVTFTLDFPPPNTLYVFEWEASWR